MIDQGAQVGSYRILQQIGQGGMGAVWRAEHVMLGRHAAIKVLHPTFTTDQTVVTRFFNEARAATAIADPGIVQIFDFGYHTDGSAYIVMELLNGEPLDKRLKRFGTLQPLEALRVIRQVAASVGAAHARGIVHRDLKPENVFLVHDAEVPGGERAKVLDFGIAKLASDQYQDIGVKTKDTSVIGTPIYMSPEQCKGAGMVDSRSDIYSLGCVLFSLIAGRPPFLAAGLGEIFVKHMMEPTPSLAGVVAGVGPELDQLIGKCMAKEPAHRFANGTELALALDLLIGWQSYPAIGQSGPAHVVPPRLSGGADAPVVGALTTLSASTGAAPQVPMPVGGSGRKRAAILVAGAVVMGVSGGLAVALNGGDGEAEAPAAAPAPAVAMASGSGSATVAGETPTVPATGAGSAAASVETPPTPPAAPPTLSRDDEAKGRVRAVLVAFGEWAKAHEGAPCPKLEVLGVADRVDPWQQPLQLTCTDQPGDQRIGVRSAGADGTLGTADDVTSWTMGGDITGLVHGARWIAGAPEKAGSGSAKAVAGSGKPPPKKPRTKSMGASSTGEVIDVDGDGIPDKR
jgi:serine/threonine-protein kinase